MGGGREKAPAAFCRKAITSEKEFEMWGNGKQTRSFCYIDDAVEGILRLMVSDYKKPLNIGSDEMVSMNQMAELVFKLGGKTLPIKHIPGPEGVRGRNSDNTLIKEVLGWAPSTTLEEGLGYTHTWITAQIKEFGRARHAHHLQDLHPADGGGRLRHDPRQGGAVERKASRASGVTSEVADARAFFVLASSCWPGGSGVGVLSPVDWG